MSEETNLPPVSPETAPQLEDGTYAIIHKRLNATGHERNVPMPTLTQTCPQKNHETVMADVRDFIRDAQKILQDNLMAAYLFGSFARCQETPESDIDILILVSSYDYHLQNKLSGLASDYSLDKSVLISPILEDEESWRWNQQHRTLFYKELQKDGVRLC